MFTATEDETPTAGSVSLAVTDAVLVTLPFAVGTTLIVTVAVAPLGSRPSGQLTVLELTVQFPWVAVGDQIAIGKSRGIVRETERRLVIQRQPTSLGKRDLSRTDRGQQA